MLGEPLDYRNQLISELKVPDWSGLATTSSELKIGICADDTLYIGSSDVIHAISLNSYFNDCQNTFDDQFDFMD